MRSAGPPQHDALPGADGAQPPARPAPQAVDRKRTIVFSEMTEPSGSTGFMLNGMTFDPEPHRRDDEARLGRAVDAGQRNTANGTPSTSTSTTSRSSASPASRVPYVDRRGQRRAAAASRTTVVLMQPTDFTGKFVFHCHVTFHEDHGMMAAVQVVREPTAAQARRSLVREGGLAIGSARTARARRRRRCERCCSGAARSGYRRPAPPRGERPERRAARLPPRRRSALGRERLADQRRRAAGVLHDHAQLAVHARARRSAWPCREGSGARGAPCPTGPWPSAAAAAPTRPGAAPARARASRSPCAVWALASASFSAPGRPPGGSGRGLRAR